MLGRDRGGRVMTEAEWHDCTTTPQELLDYLDGRLSHRKLRLVICSFCHLVWDKFTDERSRRAVIAAEVAADAPNPDEILRSVLDEATAAYEDVYYGHHAGDDYMPAQAAAVIAAGGTVDAAWLLPTGGRGFPLVHDIAGNPFRPVTLDPSWRTSTVVALAEQMYDSRDFSPMPILADALQDAGCENADVLDHCRGAGPHVRGCWVVDLILGKS